MVIMVFYVVLIVILLFDGAFDTQGKVITAAVRVT